MCKILSYVHRIIRLLHLRGSKRGRSRRVRLPVPSKAAAAASLPRFASTAGLCALFRLPLDAVPVIGSGATALWTGRSLAPPRNSSVLLRLGLPCVRPSTSDSDAAAIRLTVPVACSRRRLSDSSSARTTGWTCLPWVSLSSCSRRLSSLVLPGPLLSSAHLRRPDTHE